MADPEPNYREQAFPSGLSDEEAKAVEARRTANRSRRGAPPARTTRRRSPSQQKLPKDCVGIGLSGGGIRSATFCLGFFQALAKHGLLEQFDYLSTVSGGGYFGGFLGRLFTREGADAAKVEAILKDSHSREIAWLRENGRYLAPHGSGDLLTGTAVLLRGWAAVVVVLGLFFLTLFALCDLLKCAGQSLWHVWQPSLPSGLTGAVSDAIDAAPWLSSYAWLPLITLIGAVVPLAWAYWLRSSRAADGKAGFRGAPIVVALAVAVLSALLGWWLPKMSPQWRGTGRDLVWPAISIVAVLTLVWYALAYRRMRSLTSGRTRTENSQDYLDGDEFLSNRLADWLGWAIATTVALLVFAAIDTLGSRLYRGVAVSALLAPAAAGIATVPFAQKVAAMFGAKPGRMLRLSWLVTLVLNLVGLALAFVLLAILNALSHAIVEPLAVQGAGARPICGSIGCSLAIAGALLLFSFTSGRTLGFLNRSTPSAIYQARLTRAYLGASNERRLDDPAHADVTDVVPGDGVNFGDYSPHAHGGPLHIINTTINETIDGRSQIEQQDRKGLGMAVGPCGISAGVRHHATWDERRRTLHPVPMEAVAVPATERLAETLPQPIEPFSVFPQQPGLTLTPEPLDLGRWLAISGAAFSTGIGARTCLGLSLLCGLFNVRLGYYWNSGVDPAGRKQRGTSGPVKRARQFLSWLFPAQIGLIDEFTARFHGTADRLWNLSDGGVFENLGGYELIRRRMPYMIICDAGEDRDYQFEDLGNLVRKARTDFGAEITFLTADEIRQSKLPDAMKNFFGSVADLRRVKANDRLAATYPAEQPLRRLSVKNAAVARVRFVDSKQPVDSVLFYIKPTLTGDEPVDVVEYAKGHPDFPHESTADQFFDEAQWESYRRLGEHIGEKAFADWKWVIPPIQKPRPAKGN